VAARPVLFLHSSAGRYGADNQLLHLATGLDPARYAPLVVLPFAGELSERLGAAGVEVLVRPLAVLRRGEMGPRDLLRTAAATRADRAELGELIRSRAVALVHSNTSVVLGGAPAARAAGIPHVWHVRELYGGFRAWPAWRRVLLSADAVACISAAVEAQFAQHRGQTPCVRVIPDAAVPAAGSGEADVRAEANIGPGAFAVAMLGRLSDWKGQDVLIRALAQSPLADFDVVALIAGAPWPGNERIESGLRGLAAALGVEERVRFLGERADAAAVYEAANAAAVPSTRPEPLGNTALEGGLAGLPVVAANHGGLPEIVRDGETGLLVRPGDPADLARAIAELAADPASARRMGHAAAEELPQRFSPARLAESVQALYDELLGATRPQRASVVQPRASSE
jgi:glycosyltransferase involved in cell wall biosynthesis